MNKSHENLTSNFILMRKNSDKEKNGNSVMIWDTKDKKITVDIKDDKEFFNKNRFFMNLKNAKNDILDNVGDTNLVQFRNKEEKQNVESKDIPIKEKTAIRIDKNKKPNSDTIFKIDHNENTLNEIKKTHFHDKKLEIDIDNDKVVLPLFSQIKILTPSSINNPYSIRSNKTIENEVRNRIISMASKESYLNDKIRILTNQSIEEEGNEFFKFCFLCDKLILASNMICVGNCGHYFCSKCGKIFYEDKVEQGSIILKCPIYKCQNMIENEFLRKIITLKHFELYLNYKNRVISLERNIVDDVKIYTKKHILDINDNKNFLLFNKTKEQFCFKCAEPSLYGRTGKNYVKCLNCLNTICKHCMKFYTYDHLDITSDSYCKVYFRKDLKKNSLKPNNFKVFCLTILMIIASYILCTFAIFSHIKKFVRHKDYKRLRYYIETIILIFLYILIIPFMILVIPFFPIIIMMLR